jgi:malonate-semialdehyde dehydrogenase (acetylating)/methylmalonate-semialdehyde dehydrogenase
MEYIKVENYINGEFISSSLSTVDVKSPTDDTTIASVVLSTKKEVDLAVKAAKAAQKDWKKLSYKQRSKFFFKYLVLLEENREDLASCIQQENGKDIIDANAEVDKAIELCEFTCSIAQDDIHSISEVSNGITCSEQRRPLGIVSSISPFNFPLMVPHWTVLNAIMMGNAMILKPSETTPISAIKMAQLFKKAGFPDGILNVINGGKDAVEAICDHEDIKALSFVGSTPVAKIVYKRATSNLKRALCLGGAKNFLILTPDAEPQMAVSDIIASFSGMNGQRCMAASVLIAVGNCDHIISKVVDAVKEISNDDGLAPVISDSAITKLNNYMQKAQSTGAKLLVDGSKYMTNRKGYYTAPSIIDYRSGGNMEAEEVFGAVLEIKGADTLEEALLEQNNSPYGNGTSIFTQSGKVSEDAVRDLEAGMIGVNIGIPVPREPFSFGGIKDSKFGYGDITGKQSLNFWSDLIKVTTKYSGENKIDWQS